MDNLDIELERENFAIQASIIRMDLQRMIEKISSIHKVLDPGPGPGPDPQVSTTDFYRPNLCSDSPPKKKMRIEDV